MIGTVRTKDGVKFDRIAPAGFRILAAIQSAAELEALELEITSGTDAHRAPDPHTRGEAFDLSIKTIPIGRLPRVLVHLLNRLPPALFTVLLEAPSAADLPEDHTGILEAHVYINPKASGPHLHVQVKKGTTYPPALPTPAAPPVRA